MLHELSPRVHAFIERHLADVDAASNTPIVVIDLDVVRAAWQAFRAAFPRVEPFYAIKANPEPPVIETLRDLGASFDVASAGELRELRRLGVSTDRMIFANPVRPRASIDTALTDGVRLFTADSLEELDKLAESCRAHGASASVLARIWVPNLGSIVDLSSKFGADEATTVAMFAHAREHCHELTLRGLAFHVGSQCQNPANFKKAFAIAKRLMGTLADQGHALDTLDIGGGLPVNYTLEVSYVEDVVEALAAELGDIPDAIRVIAEPGRTFAATAATLFTRIIGRTRRTGKLWYYIDDSIYSTFSGKIFDFTDYRFYPLGRAAHPAVEVTIAGCTCDGHDIITKQAVLPDDLREGDILYATNIGAYTTASASAFNGFLPAPRHCLPLSQPASTA